MSSENPVTLFSLNAALSLTAPSLSLRVVVVVFQKRILVLDAGTYDNRFIMKSMSVTQLPSLPL